MANPKTDPVGFLLQCRLNPSTITYHGSKADALQVVDDELLRLDMTAQILRKARASIASRSEQESQVTA